MSGHNASASPLREVAHDLLQPTTTIAALVEAALVQPDLPHAVRRCLQQIGQEARYANDTCLLFLTEEQSRTVRIDRLAEAAVASARATYPGELSLVAFPAMVAGEPVALRRAITNLLDNACRAAGDGGQVELRVGCADDETVIVEVNDSGPGFGAGPSGHAALGLAVVRRVADSHGGRLVISASPLGGAAVRLELPNAVDGDTGERAARIPTVAR
jgi:signal transduction histidine kinase